MMKPAQKEQLKRLSAEYEKCLAEMRGLRPGKRSLPRRRALQERAAALGVEMRRLA